MFATATLVTVSPAVRSARKSTSPCTPGISGIPASCHGRRTYGRCRPGGSDVEHRPGLRGAVVVGEEPGDPGVLAVAGARERSAQQAFVAEPERAGRPGRADVAHHGSPFEPGER